jgi:hypothetical protein
MDPEDKPTRLSESLFTLSRTSTPPIQSLGATIERHHQSGSPLSHLYMPTPSRIIRHMSRPSTPPAPRCGHSPTPALEFPSTSPDTPAPTQTRPSSRAPTGARTPSPEGVINAPSHDQLLADYQCARTEQHARAEQRALRKVLPLAARRPLPTPFKDLPFGDP